VSPRWVFHLFGEATGVLLAMGVAMAICYKHDWRFDLSTGRRYTLSPLTQSVLRSLDKPVKITAFVREEDPRLRDLLDLLRRVSLRSPQITYRVLELRRNPTLAAQYGVEFYGTLVLECEGRRRRLSNVDESSLLGGLVSVSRSERKKVYFVTGHGEKGIEGGGRRRAMGSVRRALAAKVYDLAEIRFLAPDGAPSDASVLVLAGPKKDLLPREGELLEEYVRGGGAALVMIDPVDLPVLERTLRGLGIAVEKGIVVDPASRLAQGEPTTFEASGRESNHPITASLESGPVFSGARPLSALSDGADVRTFVLLESSPRAWVHERADEPAGLVPAPADRPGPVALGVGSVVSGVSGGGEGRVIVYGDSDFATDLFASYLGSRDLFVNTVDWLSGELWLMASAPRLKRPGIEVFYVTAAQQLALFWLSTVAEPLAFLLIGVVIYFYRRGRT